jgi:hypothetical protein
VKDSIDREELKVVGAFYNQGSGIVDFLWSRRLDIGEECFEDEEELPSGIHKSNK